MFRPWPRGSDVTHSSWYCPDVVPGSSRGRGPHRTLRLQSAKKSAISSNSVQIEAKPGMRKSRQRMSDQQRRWLPNTCVSNSRSNNVIIIIIIRHKISGLNEFGGTIFVFILNLIVVQVMVAGPIVAVAIVSIVTPTIVVIVNKLVVLYKIIVIIVLVDDGYASADFLFLFVLGVVFVAGSAGWTALVFPEFARMMSVLQADDFARRRRLATYLGENNQQPMHQAPDTLFCQRGQSDSNFVDVSCPHQ